MPVDILGPAKSDLLRLLIHDTFTGLNTRLGLWIYFSYDAFMVLKIKNVIATFNAFIDLKQIRFLLLLCYDAFTNLNIFLILNVS